MSLRDKLEIEAAKYCIIVNDDPAGVTLDLPPWMQFEPELHALVCVQWDNEPMPNVIRRAIKDVQDYGPYIDECPEDCSCREVQS